jgi:hypothetical protein
MSHLCQYFPSPLWQLEACRELPFGVFVFVRNNYEYAVAVVPGLRRNVDDLVGFYFIFPTAGGSRNVVCFLRDDASEIGAIVESLSLKFTDPLGFGNFMRLLRRFTSAVMRPNSLGIYTDASVPGHYPSDGIAQGGETDLLGMPWSPPVVLPSREHEEPISRKRARVSTPPLMPPPPPPPATTTSQPTTASTTDVKPLAKTTKINDDDYDEGMMCCFCKMEPSDTIVLPCMHRVLCLVCARKFTNGTPFRCLVCRDSVEHMICPDNSVIALSRS